VHKILKYLIRVQNNLQGIESELYLQFIADDVLYTWCYGPCELWGVRMLKHLNVISM